MADVWQYLQHYVEYAPGVLAMAAVLWRIDKYAAQIVSSCVKCWEKDQEGAHDGGKSLSDS